MNDYQIGSLIVYGGAFLIIYFIGSIFIELDTRPNKYARRKIKEIAKKENKLKHQIVNEAIDEYIEKYEKQEIEQQEYREMIEKETNYRWNEEKQAWEKKNDSQSQN